ncbi:MAG: rod shape-determining protein MreC, partial [Deinococcota bacterium]|nr:rod shape-determining protein MreC [Deinococcota bacterium]
VEPGDLVETSSRGGLFPRGIVVGTVVQVKPRDPNSLRTELIVRPAVDLRGLLEVALIEPI